MPKVIAVLTIGPMAKPSKPSVKFTAFDDRDSWKLALIRELIKSGYTVDGKRILK